MIGTMTEELDFLRELRETSEELEEQMMATERELREVTPRLLYLVIFSYLYLVLSLSPSYLFFIFS